jgi:hypothetical protein
LTGGAFPSQEYKVVSERENNGVHRIPGQLVDSAAGYVQRNRLEMLILGCMCAVYFFAYFQRVAADRLDLMMQLDFISLPEGLSTHKS